jgi:hypothetical protein
VGAKEKMTSIGRPVPELPVADVERAQQQEDLGAGVTERGSHAALLEAGTEA